MPEPGPTYFLDVSGYGKTGLRSDGFHDGGLLRLSSKASGAEEDVVAMGEVASCDVLDDSEYNRCVGARGARIVDARNALEDRILDDSNSGMYEGRMMI